MDHEKISNILKELIVILKSVGPEFSLSELEFDEQTDELLAEWVFDIRRYSE
jgi:hypothetical protein